MEINAHFSQRAVVHAARLPWVASPSAGVERRMLDRIGDEVARATSIVRYAPASRFPPHTHGAGEEFLVLEGVFQDEHGDYPPGTYVRNPPTSRHTPASTTGCVIFVKLRQFAADDRTHVRIDTHTMSFVAARGRPGVDIMPLFHDAHEDVRLERWTPLAQVSLAVPGGAELLVLEGQFQFGNEQYDVQSWLRLPPGDALEASAGPEGCRLWVKSGHLYHDRQGSPVAAEPPGSPRGE